jgi:hypothetical protein
MNEPATDKQLALLQRRNIQHPTNITKQEASKLIDSLMPTRTSAVRDVSDQYSPQSNPVHGSVSRDAYPQRNTNDSIKRQCAFKGAIEVTKMLMQQERDDLSDVAILDLVTKFTNEFDDIL